MEDSVYGNVGSDFHVGNRPEPETEGRRSKNIIITAMSLEEEDYFGDQVIGGTIPLSSEEEDLRYLSPEDLKDLAKT